MKVKKEMQQMIEKRPVKMVALQHDKFGRKEGAEFRATKDTAATLIKKGFAKKA